VTITAIPWSGPALLWRVDLDAAPEAAAAACLSTAERERAERFVFPRDRARFVAAHAALRQVLAAQTRRAAARLEFVEGPFGKPVLAGDHALHFNLSHSQSLGLIAISRGAMVGAEIGVDVELMRPVPDAMELAARCFSTAEVADLRAAPPGARDRAFLVGWTRKEACIKALGLGMSVDLPRLHVGLETTKRGVEYVEPESPRPLSVVSLFLGSDVVGAVAFDGRQLDNENASTSSMPLETTE
jgi:4'-phosphopantetheinyl transferase